MRKLLVIALVLGLAGVASAADLGNQMPAKATPNVPQNIPNPDRQGGDTVLNATVIPGLPYNNSGTTAGYNDDYDEVCPYSNSTAPDVVYRFTPGATAAVNIDLCGSSYDTKLYVYDSGLSLVACNDDFYFDDVCGVYVSKLENITLNAGMTYYIIIDGYGGDFGPYILDIQGFEPCDLICPAEGVAEGEPPLVDNYSDHHNGGCNTDPVTPVFQDVVADPAGNQILCGVSGWYLFNGSNYRDTDWYYLYMGPGGTIECTMDAEQPTFFFELAPQDCATVAVAQQATAGACQEAYMTISGYGVGSVVWFWAGPTVFVAPAGADNEYEYIVWFTGLEPGFATESTTWSSVKALY
jgi:hypothetical protein